MKNSFEWDNRPNVESNIKGSIGKDIIVLPKLNLAISQLIERRGDLNIAPFKCAIGRGISAIREKRSRNSFIFYLLKEKKKELKISDDAGTVFGSINKEGLHSLPLIVPSDNDIERFHSQVSLIDKYIESLSFESFHLRTLLSLLTSKLS